MVATRRQSDSRSAKHFHLLEDEVRSPSGRVDDAAGVIRNVKILGRKSSNGRTYSADAIRRAAHFYEGISVRVNHPPDPEDSRDSEDVLGWLRNVRIDKGGDLYGDLHCLKTHPMTPRLLEAAKRNPKLFGLSHHASGNVEMVDGTPTVTDISELKSVDLVADPASTHGLFESANRKPLSNSDARRSDDLSPRNRADQTRGKRKMKLLEYVGRIKLLPPTRQRVMKLIEAYSDPDAEVSVMEADDVEASAGAMPTNDPADMDPEAALRAGFRAAIMAIVDDQTLPAKDKIGRFKELVMTAEKLLGQGVEIPEAEEDSDLDDLPADESALTEAEGCDDPAKKDAVPVKESVESLKRQNAQLIRERAARELCETNGVRPTAVLLEALAALDSDAKRLSLLEAHRPERKAKSAPTYDPSRPSRRDDEIDDTEAFVRAVTRHDSAA